MERSGAYITDDSGRILILRGVNLGGNSKIPLNSVSFTGRPFPAEEAPEHFERLAGWGFTFIRFIVTWEALEHEGPGIYDEEYLAYLRKITLAAEEKGISVYIDPHQDVWSRWTGGDGAPKWTLEKLGLDTDKLDAAGAAITPGAYSENNNGKAYPQMIWPVNYSLYAAATLFTLFFGGKTYAPECKIEGENVQDFLQNCYLAAFRHCFRRLKNCKAIAGWGAMNEPHPGFIGNSNLQKIENAALVQGPVPSPFQAMLAASGRAVEVPVYTPWIKGWKRTGKKTINPRGVSVFKPGFGCPWKQAGVWADAGDSGQLLKPDHFANYQGRPARFTDDFLKPFMLRFMERMHEVSNEKFARPMLFFIEGVPHAENPHYGPENPQNTVNAFHHYDGLTLFTRSFRPWLTVDNISGRIILGRKKVAAHYSACLAEGKAWTRENMGDMPCLLGEFGLPFDLNHKKAYKTGDYSPHEEALSLYYDAIDENLLGSTIWNYTPDNTHESGDHWNREDLSIVSNGKPRAIGGWLRPYPVATAGIPLKFTWNRKKAELYFRFRADPGIEAPTEIFIPSPWFTENPAVSVKICPPGTKNEKKSGSPGKLPRTEYRREEQRLFIYNEGHAGELEIIIGKNLQRNG